MSEQPPHGQSLPEPVRYLFGLERFGIKLGLENIRTLCRALGDPHLAYPTILIGGTNGKGSVAAIVATTLQAAGHRTGLYTSPHIVRLEERFAIAGTPVQPEILADAAQRVRETIEQLVAARTLPVTPTFFEATTALAFDLFRRSGVEIAVLEVGLGGRFDATNVAEPIAAAITSIAFDHEKYLGRSLGEIAFEKAGIVRSGIPVVLGAMPDEPLRVILDVCRRTGAMALPAAEGAETTCRLRGGDTWIRIVTPGRDYGERRLGLTGRHQAQNALVAVRLLEQLGAGVPIGPDAIARGLETVRWRGRLERIAVGRGGVVLDAAHNPAGAAALAAYLREAYPQGVALVFGAMQDKNTAGMLRELLPCAVRAVLTRPATPRAAEPDALLPIVRRLAPALPCRLEPDARRAVLNALATDPVVCVAGSIYLLGDVLPALDPAARDASG